MAPEDVVPSLLMRGVRRRISLDRPPPRQVVVQFGVRGACTERHRLVLARPEPSACRHHSRSGPQPWPPGRGLGGTQDGGPSPGVESASAAGTPSWRMVGLT